MASPSSPSTEAQTIRELATAYERLTEQVSRVIVGQKPVVEQLLMALFSRGHCLMVGVPGLGKTLLGSTLSKILTLSFKHISFTSDLLPCDITGMDGLQEDPESGKKRFVFQPGPLFANVILADELDRTVPKTQTALLDAMQDGQVTLNAKVYKLPSPFIVLATHTPPDLPGAHPLTEAQRDHFLFSTRVEYPTRSEEIQIVKTTTGASKVEPVPILDLQQLLKYQEIVRQVVVADHVFKYVADLVRATRPKEAGIPKWIPALVSRGAGPRASQSLILGAKARAVFNGRVHVTTNDIKAIAHAVLRHRIGTTKQADTEGMTPDDIIERLLETIPVATEAKRL